VDLHLCFSSGGDVHECAVHDTDGLPPPRLRPAGVVVKDGVITAAPSAAIAADSCGRCVAADAVASAMAWVGCEGCREMEEALATLEASCQLCGGRGSVDGDMLLVVCCFAEFWNHDHFCGSSFFFFLCVCVAGDAQ
jgi:hypothetical protein